MMNEQNRLNQITTTNFPVMSAPVFGDLTPIEEGCQRMVIGQNGTFYEVNNDWLSIRRKISKVDINMPFGAVENYHQFKFGKLDLDVIRKFIEVCKKNPTREVCGLIYWNKKTNKFLIERAKERASSIDMVSYEIEVKQDADIVFIGDIHSHPESPAFFSRIDDEDDARDIKISIVVGLNGVHLENVVARLCLNGMFIPIESLADNLIEEE